MISAGVGTRTTLDVLPGLPRAGERPATAPASGAIDCTLAMRPVGETRCRRSPRSRPGRGAGSTGVRRGELDRRPDAGRSACAQRARSTVTDADEARRATAAAAAAVAAAAVVALLATIAGRGLELRRGRLPRESRTRSATVTRSESDVYASQHVRAGTLLLESARSRSPGARSAEFAASSWCSPSPAVSPRTPSAARTAASSPGSRPALTLALATAVARVRRAHRGRPGSVALGAGRARCPAVWTSCGTGASADGTRGGGGAAFAAALSLKLLAVPFAVPLLAVAIADRRAGRAASASPGRPHSP